jgi:hypothetical protein
MKLSQVQISDLKQYANVYHNADDNLFSVILTAGKTFITTYTGLPLYPDCDNFEDLTIALFVLCNEMYDVRDFTVDNVKVNFVVKQILDSHSVNYL